MQKASNVYCQVGKCICRVNFIVTKLLHNANLVLGINWLSQWKPMIDWKTQNMNIWTRYEWNKISGNLLQSVHSIGTVKDFVYCGMSGKRLKCLISLW